MARKATASGYDPGVNTAGEEVKPWRRSRSRQPGSIQGYDTDKGKRWRFQIYVLKDPEYPEMGMRRLTRSGFTSTDEANDALQEAFEAAETEREVRKQGAYRGRVRG